MQFIGKYKIEREIGLGGMSNVYLGLAPEGKQVAIKLLRDHLRQDTQARIRFEREIELVRQLGHPAIVPIIDFGEADGRMFVVMPYMPGGSLRKRLESGPLSLTEVVSILKPIASALDTAHKKQIIHRDIKPHNMLLCANKGGFLSDFGVARLVGPDGPEHTVTLIGTPEFLAPEQALEGELTPQTDIYQLGVSIFYLLTGRLPYEGPAYHVVSQHLTEPIPSVCALNPSLPCDVDRIIGRAMAKLPAERYRSASAVVVALEDALLNPQATRVGIRMPAFPPASTTHSAVTAFLPPVRTTNRFAHVAMATMFTGALLLSGFTFFYRGPQQAEPVTAFVQNNSAETQQALAETDSLILVEPDAPGDAIAIVPSPTNESAPSNSADGASSSSDGLATYNEILNLLPTATPDSRNGESAGADQAQIIPLTATPESFQVESEQQAQSPEIAPTSPAQIPNGPTPPVIVAEPVEPNEQPIEARPANETEPTNSVETEDGSDNRRGDGRNSRGGNNNPPSNEDNPPRNGNDRENDDEGRRGGGRGNGNGNGRGNGGGNDNG